MTTPKPWPNREDYCNSMGEFFSEIAEVSFKAGHADAAMERLRIAMEHINHAPRCAMMQEFGRMACDCGYHEALAIIGELPQLPGGEHD